MISVDTQWKETIIQCLALATRLEGEGQYNNAKLLRAAADSLGRKAAYRVETSSDSKVLAESIHRTADRLAELDMDSSLLDTIHLGADALASGRLPLIHETPNPYVCRTCGYITLEPPQDKCPICAAWAPTFQFFPPVYWLNAYEPFPALERLQQTPKDVAGLLDGLTEEQMNRRPADGGWAILHTVTHLRDAQGVISHRIDLFLKEEHPILESKAVFAWANAQEGKPASTHEIFEMYRASRQSMVEILREVPLGDWFRTGQHEEFGTVTLRQQVSYFTAHEMTHLPQIETLRRVIVA